MSFGVKPRLPPWTELDDFGLWCDDSLARLDGGDLTGKLLCLSRWDAQPDSRTPR